MYENQLLHSKKLFIANFFFPTQWCKFIAALELIPVCFCDFFAGKSWAAVCARGYYYWIHLRARCVFGAGESDIIERVVSLDNDTSIPKPPSSVLHAAVIVRMHGRTLVQFMRQCCEQKLCKRRVQLSGANKENVCSTNRPNSETEIKQSTETSKTAPWSSGQLTGKFSLICFVSIIMFFSTIFHPLFVNNLVVNVMCEYRSITFQG